MNVGKKIYTYVATKKVDRYLPLVKDQLESVYLNEAAMTAIKQKQFIGSYDMFENAVESQFKTLPENDQEGELQNQDIKFITSPFIRCMQTACFMQEGLFTECQASRKTKTEKILFLTSQLANRHKGKSLSFYRDSYVVQNQKAPGDLINTYCNGLLSSYHMNTLGDLSNGIPFCPGKIEDKP